MGGAIVLSLGSHGSRPWRAWCSAPGGERGRPSLSAAAAAGGDWQPAVSAAKGTPHRLPRRLSRDPAVIEDFRRDPLVARRQASHSHGQPDKILAAGPQNPGRRRPADAPHVDSSRHRRSDHGSAGSRIPRTHCAVSSSRQTLKLYSGLYHDLFHEPEHGGLTADVLGWLAARA